MEGKLILTDKICTMTNEMAQYAWLPGAFTNLQNRLVRI